MIPPIAPSTAPSALDCSPAVAMAAPDSPPNTSLGTMPTTVMRLGIDGKLVRDQFRECQTGENDDGDSRPHKGERRVVKIDPVSMGGPRHDGWGGHRTQSADDADEKRKK